MGTSFKSVWKPWDPKLIWKGVIYTVFYPQIFTIFLKRLTRSDFISTPHKSSPYETPSEMERVHRKIKSLSCRVLFSWKHFFYCSRVCMHTSARTTSNMESGWERKYGMKARLQWNTQTPNTPVMWTNWKMNLSVLRCSESSSLMAALLHLWLNVSPSVAHHNSGKWALTNAGV